MAAKEFHTFLGQIDNGSLQEIAARGTADIYRSLPTDIREQLYAFLQRTGIATHKTILLNMMLQDKHPDVLTALKLEELIDEIRARVIKTTMSGEQEKKQPAPETKPAEGLSNPHRLLPYKELSARFAKLRVNLEDLLLSWESVYAFERFGKAVSKSMGTKHYHLTMPAVTHRAMEAFEKAYHERRIDGFMVDDARIADGATLRAYERKTLKRFARKYSYRSLYEAEVFLDRTTTAPPIVRIVGYSGKRMAFDDKHAGRTFQEQSPREPHHETMGLGTYIRLRNYLFPEDPETLEMITTYTVKGSNAPLERTILLNNKTPDGQILTVGPDPKDPRMAHSIEVGPAITQVPYLFETPVHIVTSDDLGSAKNRNDRRYLGHTSTWPAPPDPDGDDIPF